MLDPNRTIYARLQELFAAQRGEESQPLQLPKSANHLMDVLQGDGPVLAHTLGGWALGFVNPREPLSVVVLPASKRDAADDLGLAVNFTQGRRIDNHVHTGSVRQPVGPWVDPLKDLSPLVRLADEPAGAENFANRLAGARDALATGWTTIRDVIARAPHMNPDEQNALNEAAQMAENQIYRE
jgi:hypothetical protein